MRSLDFKSTNYFENYETLREGFIVSTCVTLAKNYKTANRADKIFEKHKTEIMEILSKFPNPFSKFKPIIVPSLWNSFDVITSIFHFVNITRRGKYVHSSFMELACYLTPELQNFVKSGYRTDPAKIFDGQIDRLHKSILTSFKNPRKRHDMTEEVERVIAVMTLLREYVGDTTSYAHNEAIFKTTSEIIYEFVLFYIHSTDVKLYRETVVSNMKDDMSESISAVLDVIGVRNVGKVFKYSLLESHTMLPNHKSIESIESKLKGTRLHKHLSFSEIDYPSILKDYDSARYRAWAGPLDQRTLLASLNKNSFLTYGSEVVETDSLDVELDTVIHCIGVAIYKATVHKVHVLQFIADIVVNVRASVLMREYDSELNKRTDMKVITIEKDVNAEVSSTLAECQTKITELQLKLDSAKSVDSENEKLKLEVTRLKSELEKKSTNEKELRALRSLTYADNKNFFEETETPLLEQALEFLKDKKILLVGGYQGWANRLKDKLPNLMYLDPNSQSRRIDSIFKQGKGIVVCNTALNSHGMSYKIMPMIEKNNDIQLVMVHYHQNIDKVIEYIYNEVKS